MGVCEGSRRCSLPAEGRQPVVPVRVELVYGESAATLSGRQDPRAHRFLLVWTIRAWASPAQPTWGCDGRGGVSSGPPVRICKVGTVSPRSARDRLHRPHQVMARASRVGISPTRWLWGNPEAQARGQLHVSGPRGLICGEETEALVKVLFPSVHALSARAPSRRLLHLRIRLTPSVSQGEEGARPQTGPDVSSGPGGSFLPAGAAGSLLPNSAPF